MSYALEVHPRAVRLTDLTGRTVEAEIFLRAVGSRGVGPERLLERLNDPETGFLAATVDGEIELLQLDLLSVVEVDGRAPEVDESEELGATVHPVELVLLDGTLLSGDLRYLRPSGQQRVSDFFNHPEGRFFALEVDGTTRYVSHRAVVRVKP